MAEKIECVDDGRVRQHLNVSGLKMTRGTGHVSSTTRSTSAQQHSLVLSLGFCAFAQCRSDEIRDDRHGLEEELS